MVERLYLVRHGEAKPSEEDPGRSLTDQGRQDVEGMATWAAATGVQVDRIQHSGKRRAEQTAEIFARHLQPPGGTTATSGLDPNDDVRPVARSLQPDDSRVMLVGHLPFMSRLVSELLFGIPDRPLAEFDAAALAILQRHEHGWTLNCLMQPNLLH